MNWMTTFKRLLGRFWHDVFEDGEFLLGIEYLHSLYSKLVENQYLNWRNGLIAKDLSVEQDQQPFLVYLEKNTTREWYPLEHIFDDGTAADFANNTSDGTTGWLTDSLYPIPDPAYMLDHVYGYKMMLVAGLDYEVQDGKFLFHVDPEVLWPEPEEGEEDTRPIVKMLDADGLPKEYYKLFGYARKTTKVCDPVTGFESSWLNDCSDIVWDIHQNGVTYYNMKQLLGKVTDSVICEEDGTIDTYRDSNDQPYTQWTEQGRYCISVNGKLYSSTSECNFTGAAEVHKGDVLFGSLKVYQGSDTPSAADVPGIRIQTDAGPLVALNQDEMEPYDVDGLMVLPLVGATDDDLAVEEYKERCAENSSNELCPYIQVPAEVNPFLFVTQTLRRGRSVIVRLSSEQLDRLAAALNTIRKSCCAAGMVNVYVAAETAEDDAEFYYHKLSKVGTAPTATYAGQQYYNTTTKLIYTAERDMETDAIFWPSDGVKPSSSEVYEDASTGKVYVWRNFDLEETTKTKAATIELSCFSADAGMMAIAVEETFKVRDIGAGAEVIL